MLPKITFLMKKCLLLLLLGVPVFGFGKNHQVIEVQFVDAQEQQELGMTQMPIEQLPDTFAINTELTLGDEQWIILDADPTDKSAFRQTGRLTLQLAKPETGTIDPREILFSLPTINDALPSLEPTESLAGVLVFLEDDWRQFEFIEASHAALIETELAAIGAIYQDHREGPGFNNLHVRKAIVDPLNRRQLHLSDIESAFAITKKHPGIAFNTTAAIIVGGFAWETKSGWLLWGQANDQDQVLVLNLQSLRAEMSSDMAQQVNQFAHRQQLNVVHWPKLFWGGENQADMAHLEGL